MRGSLRGRLAAARVLGLQPSPNPSHAASSALPAPPTASLSFQGVHHARHALAVAGLAAPLAVAMEHSHSHLAHAGAAAPAPSNVNGTYKWSTTPLLECDGSADWSVKGSPKGAIERGARGGSCSTPPTPPAPTSHQQRSLLPGEGECRRAEAGMTWLEAQLANPPPRLVAPVAATWQHGGAVGGGTGPGGVGAAAHSSRLRRSAARERERAQSWRVAGAHAQPPPTPPPQSPPPGAGHVIPGAVFIVWGVGWAANVCCAYLWRSSRRRYVARAWYPMPLAALRYAEPVLKLLLPPLAISIELYWDHDAYR